VGLASLAVVMGGALWGLFWLPVRMFEDMGLTGPWPGLVIYVSALVLLAPLAIARGWPAVATVPLATAGLLTGAAFAFYGTAIALTDVLRAILFFYLTPVWGTIIGVLFLRERLTVVRVLAILLAFAGLFAVVGLGSRSALNLGDALALASGVFWAVGSYGIYRINAASAVHLSVAFLLGSIAVTVLLLVVGGATLAAGTTFPAVQTILPYAALAGLFAVPMILLTIWPASILTPARIGILLMSEVVVGVASVALLAGEPFGPFEALGAALIVAASLIEVLGNRD
jgi:drug/metabolite transporter (DMT)-like permease